MYMYVRQVMRSLAAAGGRFHGYVGQYMSLLTLVDAVCLPLPLPLPLDWLFLFSSFQFPLGN